MSFLNTVFDRVCMTMQQRVRHMNEQIEQASLMMTAIDLERDLQDFIEIASESPAVSHTAFTYPVSPCLF